jgi:hypothetical protein
MRCVWGGERAERGSDSAESRGPRARRARSAEVCVDLSCSQLPSSRLRRAAWGALRGSSVRSTCGSKRPSAALCRGVQISAVSPVASYSIASVVLVQQRSRKRDEVSVGKQEVGARGEVHLAMVERGCSDTVRERTTSRVPAKPSADHRSLRSALPPEPFAAPLPPCATQSQQRTCKREGAISNVLLACGTVLALVARLNPGSETS